MDLALFDFDGTITSRECMPDFMRYAVRRGRLVAGYVLLSPLIAGYKARVVSGSAVRAAIVRFGFAGVPLAEVEARARAFAHEVLPAALRPESMARIAWHRARGDRVVVVSGALDVYLRPWCDAHGLELIASVLEHERGVLSGRYAGAQCVGPEKARRVADAIRLDEYRRVHAYGDTHEDRELLALAHERWFRGQRIAA